MRRSIAITLAFALTLALLRRAGRERVTALGVVLGLLVEDVFGAARMVAIFAVAGVSGAAASYLASPVGISAGASGAVFGLLAALLVEMTWHRRYYPLAWKRGLWGALIVVAVAVYFPRASVFPFCATVYVPPFKATTHLPLRWFEFLIVAVYVPATPPAASATSASRPGSTSPPTATGRRGSSRPATPGRPSSR